MKKLIILSLVLVMGSTAVFGWGEKGHSVTARIAQEHLTNRAERRITRLLGGHNMAYWASWADGLRGDHRYDFTTTWHYANADEGFTYATAPKASAGDVYTAVEECISQLEKRGQTDSVRSMYLKFLIHFVGDMHCPMHAGHLADRGGNGWPVEFRGRKTNLHSLWDSAIIDGVHYSWSAPEWAENIDVDMKRRRRREVSGGTPLEWMEQTVILSHDIYANSPQGEDLQRDYVTKYAPLVEEQLFEGGHRLARLLNEIF